MNTERTSTHNEGVLTLTDFLLARIADDEARARLIPDEHIAHEGDCMGTLCSDCGHCAHSSEECAHDCGGFGGGCRDAFVSLPWAHVRILAECEAKRRIVEKALNNNEYPDPYETEHVWDDVLPLMASVYADHSDYRPEWKP